MARKPTKLSPGDAQKLGRVVAQLSEDRLLTRDEIQDIVGLSQERRLDDFLEQAVSLEVLAETPGDAYVFAPHASAYFDRDYLKQVESNRESKRIIAKYICADMANVLPGEHDEAGLRGVRDLVLDLDAGSTCTGVAREVAEDKSQREATVNTHNLHAALVIAGPTTVNMPCGELSSRFACLAGKGVAASLRSLPAPQVALLGVSSIARACGIGCAHPEQTDVKCEMARRGLAGRLIILATHAKFGLVQGSIFLDNAAGQNLREEVEKKAYLITTQHPEGPTKPTAEYIDAFAYVVEKYWDASAAKNRLTVLNKDGKPLSFKAVQALLKRYKKTLG